MNKIDFKNLPDTTTPLSAENLNLLQDNVEDGIQEGVSGNLVVDSIKTKNMFSGFLSGAYNSSTGVFDGSTSGIATPKIEVESGEKYCLSGIQNGNTIRILFWNDNTFVSSTTLTTQTENVITMLGNKFAFQTATTTPYTNIQFEKGESKTDYRPYQDLDGVKVNHQTVAMVGQRFEFGSNIIYAGTVVVSFSSGIGYFNVSGLNLSAKPSCVVATICSEYCGIKYDYDNSTATSLKFDLHRNGAVYNKNGNVRFSCIIFEQLNS